VNQKTVDGEQMSLKRPIQVLGVSIDETAPRPRAFRRRGMTWLRLYRSDFARYKQYRPGASPLNLLFTQQGLWALLEHRIASGVNNAALPAVIKRPCLYALEIWQKAVEILTGISISCEACIGPGFYIGHFGPIFIGKDAIIGAHCSISHGVAIGESGRGTQRGTPRLGNRVLIGANAILAGKLLVGDDAVIAPNSLVIYDVSASSVMMGVPAKCFSNAGSRDIIPPEPDYSIFRSRESRPSR
jgi:serine acetyltransferase